MLRFLVVITYTLSLSHLSFTIRPTVSNFCSLLQLYSTIFSKRPTQYKPRSSECLMQTAESHVKRHQNWFSVKFALQSSPPKRKIQLGELTRVMGALAASVRVAAL